MPKRIMIVEDDPDMADIIKLVMEDAGYETTSIYSGRECLHRIKEVKPDLVLLDIMMPEMDGWEVHRRLKEDEETKDIPIIAVTAKTQSIDKMIGLHVVGVSDYITKPFGRKELVDSVKKVLGEI